MPVRPEDGPLTLAANRLRTQTREVEIAALEAFAVPGGGPPGRPDLLRALNRLSSAFYVMMLKAKAGEYGD
jgi:ethanolamine utilization cobalamin adenosyltransferase